LTSGIYSDILNLDKNKRPQHKEEKTMIKFYWDYYTLDGENYYKGFCIETKNNIYEVFRVKTTLSEVLEAMW
jgi:hypothetical protein